MQRASLNGLNVDPPEQGFEPGTSWELSIDNNATTRIKENMVGS